MPFIVDCASANDKLAPYINEVRRPGSQSPARLRPRTVKRRSLLGLHRSCPWTVILGLHPMSRPEADIKLPAEATDSLRRPDRHTPHAQIRSSMVGRPTPRVTLISTDVDERVSKYHQPSARRFDCAEVQVRPPQTASGSCLRHVQEPQSQALSVCPEQERVGSRAYSTGDFCRKRKVRCLVEDGDTSCAVRESSKAA
jgi:hypothetical protein